RTRRQSSGSAKPCGASAGSCPGAGDGGLSSTGDGGLSSTGDGGLSSAGDDGPRRLTVDRAYTAAHIEEDRRHWYFRGRLAVLLGVLERVLPPPPRRLLELGCGTGNVLQALGRFGEAVGIERDPELRAVGRAAGLDIRAGALP